MSGDVPSAISEPVRRARPSASLALALIALMGAAACSGGGSGAEGAGPDAGSPAITPPDAGPGPDAGRGGEGGAPAGCTRSEQAKTAPTTLFDAFQSEIAQLPAAGRPARVDALLAAVEAAGGTPLEDATSDRVVFLYRGAPPSGPWAVLGSFADWDAKRALVMTEIAGTDLWWAEARLPRGVTFLYKIVSGPTGASPVYEEDRRAHNVVWDGLDRKTVGEFNAVIHSADGPAHVGRLVAHRGVRATKLANARDVLVYLPARYHDGSCDRLPSVVLHDGNEALTRGNFMEAAEALYTSRPELSSILAFVALPSQDVRTDEYTFGTPTAKAADYGAFLATELVPMLSKSYRVCSRPEARGISGASLGGLVSTWLAFEQKGTWGWVGAQSASFFWENDAMIERVSREPKIAARFYLDSGCPDDNCDVTDAMAQALAAKGYDHVRVTEQGGKHEWLHWNKRLAGMLTHFRDKQTACD